MHSFHLVSISLQTPCRPAGCISGPPRAASCRFLLLFLVGHDELRDTRLCELVVVGKFLVRFATVVALYQLQVLLWHELNAAVGWWSISFDDFVIAYIAVGLPYVDRFSCYPR